MDQGFAAGKVLGAQRAGKALLGPVYPGRGQHLVAVCELVLAGGRDSGRGRSPVCVPRAR